MSTATFTTVAEMETATTASHALKATLEAKEEKGFESVTFAAQEQGGGGISIGAVVGIIVAVIIILGALLLAFVKTRNRNRPIHDYNNYPSQKQSIFALGPPKQAPQYLPTYVQPSSPYAQHHQGGLAMPQAVHPSANGYYTHAGPAQADDRVRFGSVGVVRY